MTAPQGKPESRAIGLVASRLSVFWVALTACSTALSLWVWSAHGAVHAPWLVKGLANALHVLVLPGLVFVSRLTGGWTVGDPVGTVAAHGLAWGGWILVGVVVWQVRRVWRRRPPARVAVPVSPSRRALLFDAAGAGVALFGAGSVAKGTVLDPWDLRLRTDEIAIDDLPGSLDGLRIGHISDTHVGPRIPAGFVRSAVERVLDQGVDLVLLTGDYVHDGLHTVKAGADALAAVCDTARVRLGAIGVLGNHDWYAGGYAMATEMRRIGVRMVDNERVFLDAGSMTVTRELPASGLCIAGVGDLRQHTVDPGAALGGVPATMPRLLLSHHPDVAEDEAGVADGAHRVDLMLSGHTHGGQIRLPFVGTPGVPSAHGQKYAGGLVEGPACRVLVSRGVGMSIFPIRFGVPPEVGVITLRRRSGGAS